jgi:hypothetical protein
MKVTVNKYLNARIGEASTNAACNFYHSPGDTIEIDDVLVGTEIDGNSIWYHCADDGCYYWSGGIQEVNFEMQESIFFPGKEQLRNVLYNGLKRYYLTFYKAKYPDLTGLYIGNKKTGNDLVDGDYLVFQFLAKKEDASLSANEKIPQFVLFKGLKLYTDIKEAPKAKFNWAYPGVAGPRRVGGTISAFKQTAAGTISFVGESLKLPVKKYAITNYHVIAEHLIREKKTTYDNPQSLIIAVMPAWSYSNDERNIKGKFVKGLFNQFHDTALIELNSPDLVINRLSDDTFIQGSIDIFRHKNVRGNEWSCSWSNNIVRCK